ncbi:MAG: two-component regulator propeller domain-containing protein [Candidatus Aminicenantes bacterium]|jgi:ligand-binding sensor domain-containing protein/AraC-like DNA-binding protein
MRRTGDSLSIKPIVISIILVQLLWCPIWGLDPDKTVDQYLVDQWQTPDVIPSDRVIAISQTPDGYLWLATAKGLVRYDGIKSFIIPFVKKEKIDPLETVKILTLFLDKSKTLWIGTFAGGLTSYDYKTGQFQTLTTADGLTENSIRCINEDMKGNLWIGFYTGYAGCISNGKFTTLDDSHGLTGNEINTIVEDHQGNLLFGSRENGLYKYKDGKFFKYHVPALEDHKTITMHEDTRGDIWIGTNIGLLKVTTTGTKEYTVKDGLSGNYITNIKEDSDRNLWVGTTNGLNRIKRNQDGTIDVESLLQFFKILSLFEDTERNLWVGTDGSGLIRLKDGKFMSYAPLDARPETVISVFADRHGDTWCGTLEGKLLHCRGSNFLESIEPAEISGTGITAIAEDARGHIWLGTIGNGVFQRKSTTLVQFTTRENLADNQVNSIYRDSRNNLWFSTFDGVSVLRFTGDVIETLNSRNGLLGKRVNNVYEDKKQNIWIAADKGITVLKGGKIAKKNSRYYLRDVPISCIYEDPSFKENQQSVYWIATYGAGLKRLTLEDRKIISDTSYTTHNGMATNFIFQFLEDQSNFWLMSDNGVLLISKTELEDFANGEAGPINCISFGISDGLKSIEFNNELSSHSMLQTNVGELWFITNEGIAILNPGKIKINKTPPPLVMESIFFNHESVPLHRVQQVFKGIKDFTFHFTAPTFLSPEKIKFKYQLEGFDSEWVFLPPGKDRAAHYRDLGPGTYTFKVTACNAEGVWNQTGTAVTFTLKPFFYQTLLFKIAVFLLFVSLLTAAVYIYKKRPFDKKKKYKDSSLNPQFAEVCIKRLNYLVENEKIYLDETISLQSLAEKLNIQPYQLSQLLNEKIDQSFSDFINYHRIEEAKKILADPKGAEKKNTAVAFDVGFNSMTAFYKAFKKFTSMTPSIFKKEIHK